MPNLPDRRKEDFRPSYMDRSMRDLDWDERGRGSRKRQRMDDDYYDNTSEGNPLDGECDGHNVKDKEFYSGPQEANESVFCFKGVLFKLSDSALKRCPSLMTLLLNEDGQLQRTTDDEPLCMHSRAHLQCTRASFRALVWALHTPEERLRDPQPYADTDRILTLAPICTVFGLDILHNWVLGIIKNIVADDVLMDSCASATLQKLIQVASRLNLADVLSTAASKWYNRILTKKEGSIVALQTAEKYNLDDLRGIAYYVHLQDMLDRQTASKDGIATELKADDKLSSAQVMRLLSGYWSLVSFWERFRMAPLELPRAPDCSEAGHKKCSTTWVRRWNSAIGWRRILSYNSADALNLISCLRDQLSNDDDLKLNVNPSCRLAGLTALKTKGEDVKKNLRSHFVACR
ncbi:hypothetical protein CC1G_02899 [Coprinopsis cinerea okayama7|uniref:BTB domain-containing protein n=1 Tax=Coprinopsis cinerea (strain Okayama-7 / 130 / ATCC MYA-4618 / FGSC 9003) TaxID=240176 RepID=A8NRM9_COPC7|nr:hypothetical protein CC1G_02899 [Coprinopsis cinerea okayama7\|eukprot:XP_001835811.2 hypothetical protein CC1G_02899 [Coprinopsis cinerea okayama7\